jgi:hypothetical protein
MTAYTDTNFRTKKQLKTAVDAWVGRGSPNGAQRPVRCHQAGLGPDLSSHTGVVAVCGPHYPAAHTWYAEVTLENGVVTKVK